MNKYAKPIQKIKQQVKSNNFCYCKVERAITNWGAREKSPILLLKYWKNVQIDCLSHKLFHILEAAIIFSSTLHSHTKEHKILKQRAHTHTHTHTHTT